jgi:ankyrin repeat protein
MGQYDTSSTDSQGRTPLFAAVELGDTGLASFFLSRNATADPLDNQGISPLMLAVSKGDAAMSAILVNAGADIFRQYMKEDKNIAEKAFEGSEDLRNSLINNITVLLSNEDGDTLLHLAARQGNAEAADAIIRNGAQVNTKNQDGLTALDLAFQDKNQVNYAQTASVLIRRGGSTSTANELYTSFAPAVQSRNYNLRRSDGTTPLQYASSMGYIGYVSWLLVQGADINMKGASGSTALIEAARTGQIAVMQELLDSGADPNAEDASGNTCLHLAVPPDKQSEQFKLLIDYGADVNLKDDHGDSPLHILIELDRSPDNARLLLDAGADLTIHNIDGKTPLYTAVENERDEMIRLLLDYDANIFDADNNGLSPFEYALTNELDCVLLLITE